MADRAQVLAYAQRHGPKAAAAHFHIPVGTIWSWRARERRRAAQRQADQERAAAGHHAPVPGPTPAEEYADRAAQLAAWVARGACLHCGGAGLVRVAPVTRAGLVIRRGRVIPCPTCGGRQVQVQVVEHPPADRAEGMRAAGDLGAGWTPEEWGRIRAGDLHPDGQRFTHRDRLEPGGASA